MNDSAPPVPLEAAVSQPNSQPGKTEQQNPLEQAQPGQLILINAEEYQDQWAGHGSMVTDYILLEPHQRAGVFIGGGGIKPLSGRQIKLFDDWLSKGVPTEKSYEHKSIFGITSFEWKLLTVEQSAGLLPVIAQYLKAEANKRQADELYELEVKPQTDALESARKSLEAVLLEHKLLPGSEESLELPQIEAPETFDIKSIGAETKQRLEGIVLGTGNPYAIAEFLKTFGEEGRASPYLAAMFLRSVMDATRVSNTDDALCNALEEAKGSKFLDKNIIAGLAALVYQSAIAEKEHELAFEIGRDFLNLPKEILDGHRLDTLYATLTGRRMEHRSFDPNLKKKDLIAKLTDGLPIGEVKLRAQLAYDELMTRKTEYRNPAEDFLAAGHVAVMMKLGTELAEHAGKEIVVYYLDELKKMREQRDNNMPFGMPSGTVEHIKAAVEELGVPAEAVKPLALYFFKNELFWQAKANKLAEFYGLQPEDTMPIVQKAYEHNVMNGRFDLAYGLRTSYPIKDSKILVEYLYLLSKIQNPGINVLPAPSEEE